jgi:hypothetical protein
VSAGVLLFDSEILTSRAENHGKIPSSDIVRTDDNRVAGDDYHRYEDSDMSSLAETIRQPSHCPEEDAGNNIDGNREVVDLQRLEPGRRSEL